MKTKEKSKKNKKLIMVGNPKGISTTLGNVISCVPKIAKQFFSTPEMQKYFCAFIKNKINKK